MSINPYCTTLKYNILIHGLSHLHAFKMYLFSLYLFFNNFDPGSETCFNGNPISCTVKTKNNESQKNFFLPLSRQLLEVPCGSLTLGSCRTQREARSTGIPLIKGALSQEFCCFQLHLLLKSLPGTFTCSQNAQMD